MTRHGLQLCTSAFFFLITINWCLAQEAAKTETAAPAAQQAPATGATHKVKQEAFKIEVEVSGVFEARQTTQVSLNPNSWANFTVLKAVEHGSRVSKGETLVWLEMKEIDEQLQDMEKTLRLNELAMQLADTELELMKTTLPLDLEASVRGKRIADEDLNYYLNIGRAMMEESARFSLKSSQQSLEYSEEELKQLEKMYKADDLTEETEEIVLKRARNEVEQGKFYLKSTELRTKKTLETDIPRQDEQLTEAAKRAEIALAKAEKTLRVQLEKEKIERDKQVIDNQRAVKKFQDLTADRQSMAVTSPVDGIVYYGRCTRGKWPGVEATASQLQERAKLAPNSIFMTIVTLRPLDVRADVAEKDLHRLTKGMRGTAVPAGFPDMKLPVAVDSVSPIPLGPGTFDGRLRVTLDEKASMVMPGMACKLTLVAYEKKDAIAVPAAAVFENPVDGERNLVYVKTAEGKSEERKVVVGQKGEQSWEITQGLTPGEEILLQKP